MKKAWVIASLIMLIVSTSPEASSQIWILGGDALLYINTALPGQQPFPVANTATTLVWINGTVARKISVATICPGQKFTLSVLATTTNAGIPAPEVQLTDGMLGVDFITDIPPRGSFISWSTQVRYTASATFEQGNSLELGDDQHTVTYTITDQ
jgi:hypothetical protein